MCILVETGEIYKFAKQGFAEKFPRKGAIVRYAKHKLSFIYFHFFVRQTQYLFETRVGRIGKWTDKARHVALERVLKVTVKFCIYVFCICVFCVFVFVFIFV